MAAPDIACHRCGTNHGTHLGNHIRTLRTKRRRKPTCDRGLHERLHALGLGRVNAFLPGGLGFCRDAAHRVTQRQALQEFRMLQRQELSDHAAQREAEKMGTGDPKRLQEGARVFRQGRERVGACRGLRLSVSPRIVT